mgnify:CR=1 FL=1
MLNEHSEPDQYAPPRILCLSGHDPTGGAGIQADIRAVYSLGCHPLSLITALTCQDSHDVHAVHPQDPLVFRSQMMALIEDVRVDAFKIGLVGSIELLEEIISLLDLYPETPVILDPILAAGGGADLASDELLHGVREWLVPKALWITPNVPEARRLTGRSDLDACARDLLEMGVSHVLLTGTHDEGPEVINRWFGGRERLEWRWKRLPRHYHGSGCTLAASLAAAIARGLSPRDAAMQAQMHTYAALESGYPVGRGQWVPGFLDEQTVEKIWGSAE